MMGQININKNMLSRLLFALFIYSYIIRAFIPVSPIVAYLPYFFIWLISYSNTKKYDGFVLIIISLFTISTILIDSQSGFAITYILLGIHAPYLLCKSNKLDSDIIYSIYFYILIPCFLLNYFFVSSKGYGNMLTYLPIPASGFKINILSQGGTVQGTSLVGIFLFIISSFNLFFNNSKRKIDRFFFILSLYFIIFSGSRAGYFSLLFVGFFIMLNRRKFRKRLISLIFLSLIISLYSIEMIFNTLSFGSDGLNGFFKVDNLGTSQGISSGRSWLWGQHISLFLDSDYYLGLGKNGFVYSLDMGDQGGSESPATDILARYGLFGLGINIFFIFLFFYSLKKGNKFGTMLMGAIILVYLGGGENCMFPPDSWNFPLFCLFFSSFSVNHFKKSINL